MAYGFSYGEKFVRVNRADNLCGYHPHHSFVLDENSILLHFSIPSKYLAPLLLLSSVLVLTISSFASAHLVRSR